MSVKRPKLSSELYLTAVKLHQVLTAAVLKQTGALRPCWVKHIFQARPCNYIRGEIRRNSKEWLVPGDVARQMAKNDLCARVRCILLVYIIDGIRPTLLNRQGEQIVKFLPKSLGFWVWSQLRSNINIIVMCGHQVVRSSQKLNLT